jgi:hypothetical protein
MSRAFSTTRSSAPPVRRGSELTVNPRWTRFSREEGHRMMFVLKVKAERLRKPGQRTGAPGTISFGALRLAEVLVSLCVKGKGRLEPSVAWLSKALNVPKKSIHKWKSELREHGFLRWNRRYVRVETPGQKGPQLKQTSNAYALSIPIGAARAAEKFRGAVVQTVARVVSPELQAALDRLQRAISDHRSQMIQRESPEASEPELT